MSKWIWGMSLNFIVASGMEEIFRKGRHEWQSVLVWDYVLVFAAWGLLAALAAFWHVRAAYRARWA